MLRKSFYAVLTVLTAAASTQAAIMLETSAPTPLSQGNLVSYTVRAVGTAGEVLNTFTNPVINPGAGSVGVHQVWFPGTPSPTRQQHTPPLWDPAWSAYDTYFLYTDTEILSLGPQITETNNAATNGTLGLPMVFGQNPQSGFGSISSDATTAKLVLAASDSVPFYQVVLRQGDTALLSLRVDGNAGAVNETFTDFCIGCTTGTQFLVDDQFLGGRLPGQIVSGGPLSTNATTADIDWSLLSLVGPDGAEAGATVDPLTGIFTWDSAPSDSRGAYTATIQGVNAGDPTGTDSGLMTFNLVPEPASVTLLGLAMAGFGFIRRR